MKFTPLARRNLSSAGRKPSITDGVLNTSSGVKNHWFAGFGLGVWGAERAGDDGTSRFLGGDVLEECVGGDGAGGGTSRLRVGDREVFCWGMAGG